MIGETLGSYRIVGTLGRGGMGAVYEAEHVLIGRKAAVKVLLPELSRDPELVERFFNEARAAAVIQHPGLVEVFDFGHHADGSAYIVMELLVGEPLATRMKRDRKLAPATALAITRQVAGALQAAHDQGIVHRDLKPENLFLLADTDAPSGVRAKVLDFGIAKLVRDEERRSVKTRTGAVIGTPRYMAPEQCKSAANVDGRADIYALGCILYEMIIGVAPFDYDSWGELVAAHIHETPRRPREVDPAVPEAVEALIERALQKKPADRYQAMSELAQATEDLWRHASAEERHALFTPLPGKVRVAAEAAAPTLPVAAEMTVPPGKPARRRVWWPLAGIAVAGAVIATVVVTRGSEESRASPPPSPPAPVAAIIDASIAPPIDAASAPEPPREVQLRIDSVPHGADVYRAADGVKLGKTPLTRTFERTDGTAELVLKLAGYRDQHVSLSTREDGGAVEHLTRARVSAPPRPVRAGSAHHPSGPTVLDPYGEGR